MLVKISTPDYKECEKAARNYWASSKKGMYGRGIINSKNDPLKVERTGLLGEMAFAMQARLPLNFEYKRFGDKYDFKAYKKTIDVKTASRDYGACLVQYMNKKGNIVFRRKHIYVTAHVTYDDIVEKVAGIELVGYILGVDLTEDLIKPARVGTHYNYEIPFEITKPIEAVIAFVRGEVDFSSL